MRVLHKIKEKELYSFTKGMYYLLKGKVELTDSLSIISINCGRDFQEKIKKTKRKIENGTPVNKAFENITNEREFLELIKIGEKTGSMETVFKNLYRKYKFRQKLRGNIRNMSIYPISVVITAFIIITILLKVVVPKFMDIYSDIGQEIPSITKAVIKLSKIIDKYGIFILSILIFGVWLLSFSLLKYRKMVEKIIINTAFIGKIYKDICVLNFTQNMESLMASQMPFILSLKLCSNSKNIILNEEIKKIVIKIEKGGSILKAFNKCSFFDREYISFLGIGEKTGEISSVFKNLSEIYYDKVRERTELFLKILEPLSIIFIGIIIGTVIFSIMLPMFKLGEII